MTEDEDYKLALKLQNEWNDESDLEEVEHKPPPKKVMKLSPKVKRSNPHSNLDPEFLDRTQNLVHPLWETLDPTPDIFELFSTFDAKFFQRRLVCVTLEWSKRMYSCAGICYSSKNRMGMSVTIRLSEPLLTLRPRKDLIETLLHEMIHAYCFVNNIREGNGGHGPNFKKIMYAINKVAGTNITVYHTFHDEVDVYKQHWWRCNGICQHRSPFFGYVKRTSNRAPGANDQWWAAHHASCGGTFMKIKGPDPKPKKSKKNSETKAPPSNDLRKFFKPNNSNVDIKAPTQSNITHVNIKAPSQSRTHQTETETKKSTPPKATSVNNSTALKNLENVLTLRDLQSGATNDKNKSEKPKDAMMGRGYSLGSNAQSPKTNNEVDREQLRNIWAKRFDNKEKGATKTTSCADDEAVISGEVKGDAKRRRLSSDAHTSTDDVVFVTTESTLKETAWIVLDDDVMFKKPTDDVIALLSSDEEETCGDYNLNGFSRPNQTQMTSAEREVVIKNEIMEDTMDIEEDDIMLIDGDYDDNEDLATGSELADTSVIDEFFGEDTLLKEFNDENDLIPTGSRQKLSNAQDIITCPICQGKMKRTLLSEHLDGCLGISRKIVFPKPALANPKAKPSGKRVSVSGRKEILRKAGYSDQDLMNISSSIDEDDFEAPFSTSSPRDANRNNSTIDLVDSPTKDDNLKLIRQQNIYKTTRQCPKCYEEVEEEFMDLHLDSCLIRD